MTAEERELVVRRELGAVKRAWVRKELADLEFRRQLVVAVSRTSLGQVADELGYSESSVSSALRTARHLSMPREGFESAGPYEVCQRYAVGELSRDEALEQLISWPYEPLGDMHTSPGDDIMIIPDGTVYELIRAESDGLIDVDMCEAVLDAVYGRA